jgi:hypothetical protein
MSDKFQNKYRIPSARLRNWDYGFNAIYFVTICTQNRKHYFGKIENGVMVNAHNDGSFHELQIILQQIPQNGRLINFLNGAGLIAETSNLGVSAT